MSKLPCFLDGRLTDGSEVTKPARRDKFPSSSSVLSLKSPSCFLRHSKFLKVHTFEILFPADDGEVVAPLQCGYFIPKITEQFLMKLFFFGDIGHTRTASVV